MRSRPPYSRTVNAADVLVVGLGAAGSAVAYQLARRGTRVIGIDTLAPPHAAGSSHGDTRITRQAVGEGAAYVPFVLRAHELWRAMEEETGERLLTVTGGLVIGSHAGEHAHGTVGFALRTIEVARRFGVAHEVLDSAELRARHPALAVRDDEFACYEPGAGYVRPERCVAAQLQLARRHGARLVVDERVEELRSDARGVVARTASNRYVANEAIVCAGAWASRLVSPPVAQLLTAYRQVMFWFDVSTAYERYTPDALPIVVWPRVGREVVYAVGAVDGVHGGFKVGTEDFGIAVDPDRVQRQVDVHEQSAMYESHVRGSFIGAGPSCVRAIPCLYTCTTDFGFIVDRDPERARVVVVSACSGHGFKHSPAIGESVAQLIVDGRSSLDLASFAITRFARPAAQSHESITSRSPAR